MIVVLQDWFVRLRYRDGYCPPECNYNVLAGHAFGHPTKEDGSNVKTSALAKVEGRIITTKTGTVYKLGRIQRKYRRWMKKNGHEYNRREPIKDLT